MQPYEFINKEWIVSATARRVYRIAAYLSIMLFLLWCYTLFEGVPRAYLPFTRLLVFAGVLGAGTVFVGMEYFLFRFDQSHPLKQVAWFCVILFPLLGPPRSTASSSILARRSSRTAARPTLRILAYVADLGKLETPVSRQ